VTDASVYPAKSTQLTIDQSNLFIFTNRFAVFNSDDFIMIGNKPSKKKEIYPVSDGLKTYLAQNNIAKHLPIQYDDMLRYMASVPLHNKDGEDTHWQTVFYNELESDHLNSALCEIYALLRTDGDISVVDHLKIDRVDFCVFGNTHPFRVRIVNMINDNYDHFYVKKIDASRVYGLELEEMLSPNSLAYIVDRSTIIEEHIAGIPGDIFIENHLDVEEFDQIRIAKEFIKFNERCFVRLLGDMRSYNYIVDITPDIEAVQYRIRAIDFDQQSYEGRKNFYFPQYFKENNAIIKLGLQHLSVETVRQYQLEERSLIARRIKINQSRLKQLMKSLRKDSISQEKKIAQLADQMGAHHNTTSFESCKTMGDIIYKNINLLLQKEFVNTYFEV